MTQETESNKRQANALRLTIRVGENDLLFAVGDPLGRQKVVYEYFALNKSISVSANLREAFHSSELLNSGYRRCLVMLDRGVMLIPVEEKAGEDSEMLYRHTYGSKHKGELVSCAIPDLKVDAMVPVNKDLRTVLEEHFENVEFLPLCQPVWSRCYRKNGASPRRKLFVYLHDHRLDLFAFSQKRFRFCNSFTVVHPKDVVYYLLYVWRLLGMHETEDELHVLGDLSKWGDLKDQLESYILHVGYENPAVDFAMPEAAADPHLPYDIKALYL